MSAPYRHYCTYFDCNYAVRALTLYRSLERTSEGPFTCWMLCLDDPSRALLEKLRLPHARLLEASALEAFDGELAATKADRSRVEYYWTTTPALPLWLMGREKLSLVTYLDADLFFFSSPEALFTELGDRSILIVPHAFPEPTAELLQYGIFNVGALAFRDDSAGRACLERWRRQCIEWCRATPEPGRFGDQVYLNEWPVLWGDQLAIAQHPGLGAGPWNERALSLTAPRRSGAPPQVNDHDMVFFHFHGLKTLSPRVASVVSMYHPRPATKRFLYGPYLRAHREAWREVAAVDPTFRAGLDGLGLRRVLSCFRHRSLFVASRFGTIFAP